MAKTPFHCEEFLMKHCDYVPWRKGGVSIILNMLGLVFEYVLVQDAKNCRQLYKTLHNLTIHML